MTLRIRIVLSILASALIMAGVAVKLIYFPKYETEAVIMVDMKKSPTSVESDKMESREAVGYIRSHCEFLKSYPILSSVADELKLYEDLPEWREAQAKGIPLDDALKTRFIQETVYRLRKTRLSIESPVFTNLIEVKVNYKDPQKAADIANRIVAKYIIWNLQQIHQEVSRISDYLAKEVLEAKARLSEAEVRLQKFREENGIVSLPDQVKTYYLALPEKLKADYQVMQAKRIKLVELEMELSRGQELYTDQSSQVVALTERISNLKKELQEDEAKSHFQFGDEGELKKIPWKESVLAQLVLDVKVCEGKYTFLLQEQEKARLLQVKQTTENIKILAEAQVPWKPAGTKRYLLLGVFLSVIAVFSIFGSFRPQGLSADRS